MKKLTIIFTLLLSLSLFGAQKKYSSAASSLPYTNQQNSSTSSTNQSVKTVPNSCNFFSYNFPQAVSQPFSSISAMQLNANGMIAIPASQYAGGVLNPCGNGNTGGPGCLNHSLKALVCEMISAGSPEAAKAWLSRYLRACQPNDVIVRQLLEQLKLYTAGLPTICDTHNPPPPPEPCETRTALSFSGRIDHYYAFSFNVKTNTFKRITIDEAISYGSERAVGGLGSWGSGLNDLGGSADINVNSSGDSNVVDVLPISISSLPRTSYTTLQSPSESNDYTIVGELFHPDGGLSSYFTVTLSAEFCDEDDDSDEDGGHYDDDILLTTNVNTPISFELPLGLVEKRPIGNDTQSDVIDYDGIMYLRRSIGVRDHTIGWFHIPITNSQRLGVRGKGGRFKIVSSHPDVRRLKMFRDGIIYLHQKTDITEIDFENRVICWEYTEGGQVLDQGKVYIAYHDEDLPPEVEDIEPPPATFSGYAVSRKPKNGTVTVIGGEVTYTPDEDFIGVDDFGVTAYDSNGNVLLVYDPIKIRVEAENVDYDYHIIGSLNSHETTLLEKRKFERDGEEPEPYLIYNKGLNTNAYSVLTDNCNRGVLRENTFEKDSDYFSIKSISLGDKFALETRIRKLEKDSTEIQLFSASGVYWTLGKDYVRFVLSGGPERARVVYNYYSDNLTTANWLHLGVKVNIEDPSNIIQLYVNGTKVQPTSTAGNSTAPNIEISPFTEVEAFSRDSLVHTYNHNNATSISNAVIINRLRISTNLTSLSEFQFKHLSGSSTNCDSTSCPFDIEGKIVDSSVTLNGKSGQLINSCRYESITLENKPVKIDPAPFASYEDSSHTFDIENNPKIVNGKLTLESGEGCLFPDTYKTSSDKDLYIYHDKILSNDLFCEANNIVRLFSNPSHGSISTSNSAGYFKYTPNSNYIGEDSFEYRVWLKESVVDPDDTSGWSEPATVHIYVSQDYDPRNFLISITENPQYGIMQRNADGTYNYVPDAGFWGRDTVSFEITHRISGESLGYVNNYDIRVIKNDESYLTYFSENGLNYISPRWGEAITTFSETFENFHSELNSVGLAVGANQNLSYQYNGNGGTVLRFKASQNVGWVKSAQYYLGEKFSFQSRVKFNELSSGQKVSIINMTEGQTTLLDWSITADGEVEFILQDKQGNQLKATGARNIRVDEWYNFTLQVDQTADLNSSVKIFVNENPLTLTFEELNYQSIAVPFNECINSKLFYRTSEISSNMAFDVDFVQAVTNRIDFEDFVFLPGEIFHDEENEILMSNGVKWMDKLNLSVYEYYTKVYNLSSEQRLELASVIRADFGNLSSYDGLNEFNVGISPAIEVEEEDTFTIFVKKGEEGNWQTLKIVNVQESLSDENILHIPWYVYEDSEDWTEENYLSVTEPDLYQYRFVYTRNGQILTSLVIDDPTDGDFRKKYAYDPIVTALSPDREFSKVSFDVERKTDDKVVRVPSRIYSEIEEVLDIVVRIKAGSNQLTCFERDYIDERDKKDLISAEVGHVIYWLNRAEVLYIGNLTELTQPLIFDSVTENGRYIYKTFTKFTGKVGNSYFTDVVPGNEYFYAANNDDTDIEQVVGDIQDFKTPYEPSIYASPGDEHVVLSWTFYEKATGTETDIETHNNILEYYEGEDLVSINMGNVRAYTVTGLRNGVEYNFTIRAEDQNGNSMSGEVSATPVRFKKGTYEINSFEAHAGVNENVLSWKYNSSHLESDKATSFLRWQYEDEDFEGIGFLVFRNNGGKNKLLAALPVEFGDPQQSRSLR